MHSQRLGEDALRASPDPVAEQLRFDVLEFVSKKADDLARDRPDLAEWLADVNAWIRARKMPPRID